MNTPATDSIRAVTINFIFTLCEINLKGLKILISRTILINGILILCTEASRIENTTIIKSSWFHESLKYEFLSQQNPNALY